MKMGPNDTRETLGGGSLDVVHVNGVPFTEAKPHSRWRRHKRQTYGYGNWFSYTERCSCGAIRFEPRGRWTTKGYRT